MQGFGELEAAIMQRLWARAEPATVREVLEDLRPERDLAYTTVQTVLEKLTRKGWLARQPDGRAHRYRTVASRSEYVAGRMHDALDDSGDPAEALLQFVGRMTLEEAAALRAALSSYERRISGR